MSTKPVPECGVVILGGTAGVGLETAAQFAERGARVVLLGRNAQRGAAACAVCRERAPGATVEFIALDATDPGAAVRAEQTVRSRLGAIDVLVNTTGPSKPPRLLHLTPIDDVRTILDGLILPPLHMTHAVLPAMREQRGGSIITVASDAAKIATPGETLIGAAMAAIVMFSRAAALEAKREGVRINLLTPSLIANTPGSAMIFGDPFSATMFEKAAGMAHLGVAEPEDLAAMALFLASPAARRITGQAISINGGISAA
jgi:NAD(P)-dependent dehydrogenase (short-subunit alcohol dehydrogenase family)